MGFRFRRSVRVFPGVRLNFSKSGISTSIGGRGASVTIGPRGAHMNLGIPGSGLSYRQSLMPTPAPRLVGGDSPAQPSPVEEWPSPTVDPPAPPLIGEIRSADNDALTSVGLRELRDLLAEAYHEYRRLKEEVPAADADLAEKQGRANRWNRGLLLKHILKKRYRNVLDDLGAAQAERKALDAEIERCRVALEIEMEGGIDTSYGALVDTFRALAASGRCWDTTSAVDVDQHRQRSQATRSVTRAPITLDLKPASVIAPSRPALHFENANGGDLYVLPGLLLVLGDERDFGLVRLVEVTLSYQDQPFQEEDGVPADAAVLGETWAKVNKDGTPDRRFRDNYRIPIVRYGKLRFTSAAGLNEEFMFSSAQRAQGFAEAFAAHKAALPLS